MINTVDFTKRLKKIIDYYEVSASAFADTLGVQRSSISHILSGRNKPSLEFVMKILDNYPEVELYWLLNGKGSFPKSSVTETAASTPTIANPSNETKHTQQTLAFTEVPSTEVSNITTHTKKIDKIVIFYTDGTFEHYQK